MKTWFTASELAGLPDLPGTVRRLTSKAQRENWTSRPNNGQGGGVEYHMTNLTREARIELARRRLVDVLRDPETRQGANEGLALAAEAETERTAGAEAGSRTRVDALPQYMLRRADARLAILALFDAYDRNCAIGLKAAAARFAAEYEAGRIPVDDETRAEVRRFHPNTLLGWRRTLAARGPAALAGGYGNRAGAGLIEGDEAIRGFIVALLTIHPHATGAQVLAGLRARLGRDGLPSARTVQRFIRKWRRENAEIATAVANPDAWKGRYMTAFGSSSEDVAGLNQRWEMDSTPADVMLADGRHAVIGVIDVWSRRAKLRVSRTSKSTAIAGLVRSALIDWGVPAEVKTDQGQDYTSRHMRRVLAGLEIEHLQCAPFSPWEKPHIERFFHSFSHGLVELLPGYIGHDVAGRQAIEARRSFADKLMKRGAVVEVRMTADEFQAFCDRWCDDVYAHAAHGGLGGASPFARAAEWRRPVRRITDERALDILLAEAPGDGVRVVGKKGIALSGTFYIAPELEAVIGRRVRVLLDETDLGRVYVFDTDGAGFVCVAEAPELTGVSRREIAIEARRRQRERVQAARRALKAAATNAGVADIAAEILAERAGAAGTVVAFPAGSVAHESEGLAEAADAVAAVTRPAPAAPELTPEQQAAVDAKWAAMEGGAPPAVTPPPTADGRPFFHDDRSFALWVRANPELATDGDRARVAELMERRSFRAWLGEEDEEDRAAAI